MNAHTPVRTPQINRWSECDALDDGVEDKAAEALARFQAEWPPERCQRLGRMMDGDYSQVWEEALAPKETDAPADAEVRGLIDDADLLPTKADLVELLAQAMWESEDEGVSLDEGGRRGTFERLAHHAFAAMMSAPRDPIANAAQEVLTAFAEGVEWSDEQRSAYCRLAASVARHRIEHSTPDRNAVLEEADEAQVYYVAKSELTMHFGPAFDRTTTEAAKGISRRLAALRAKALTTTPEPKP